MKGKSENNRRNDYIGKILVSICGAIIILITLSIIGFIFSKGIQSFIQSNISLQDVLSFNWKPDDSDTPTYGALIFMIGSIMVSIGAVIIAAPIGIMLAIFMNHVSPLIGNRVLKPMLEILLGIPSVVYGFLGVITIVPFIRTHFGGVGFSLMAGVIVLSIMILPTITSVASDAIATVPFEFLEASYSLGSTRWQAVARVVIPTAKASILTGVVLGLARAFGEALAVQMVIGNTVKVPDSLMAPTSTLTGILTMDIANTINGTPWNNILWTLAMILLFISFFFILVVRLIGRRGVRKG